MGKKDDTTVEETPQQVFNPYVGADEDDDLMDMEYMQDEHTPSVDTHPPETKEEAERRAEELESLQETEEGPPEEEEPEEEVAEDEEEEVVAEEEEPEPEPEPEPEELKVPKNRFDEVNERMKKAEQQVLEMQEQLKGLTEQQNEEPEPEPYDFAAKEKEAADALLEGDNDKYAELRAEIRGAEREEILREARAADTETSRAVQEERSFEETGAKIEAEFPQFVPGKDEYNEAARDEMLELYVGYVHSGQYSRAEALQKAADKTVKMYDFTAEETPEIDDDKVVDIKKADPKKKAQISQNQPPRKKSTDKSREEPRTDVSSMSDEEFDSLPESTKRRLRGDVL